MLNTPAFTPSSRGARPGNLNAFRHGLYTSRRSTRLSSLHAGLASLRGRARDFPAETPSQIDAARQAFWQASECIDPASSVGLVTHEVKLFCSASLFLNRLRVRDYRLTQPQRDLESVAPNALRLLRLNFSDHAITRDAETLPSTLPESPAKPDARSGAPSRRQRLASTDSFLDSSCKYEQNSPFFSDDSHTPPPLTFLTDDQWAILAPLLPSPNESFHLGRGRGWGSPSPNESSNSGEACTACPDSFVGKHSRSGQGSNFPSPNVSLHLGRGQRWGQGQGRGRPATDPRRLLDAIFWKLATASTWADLPSSFPPAPTCRRYYRRLFRSGRLLTIYTRLFHHLEYHFVYLSDLVDQHCFIFLPRQRLDIHPDLPLTWHLRTALLFMQLASQVYRRRRRELLLERRLKYPFLGRMPAFPKLRSLRRSSARPPRPSVRKSPPLPFAYPPPPPALDASNFDLPPSPLDYFLPPFLD